MAALLAFIAVVQLVLDITVILQPEEFLYGEGMVYDHAARLVRGELLYQPLNQPPYTVAAYTPLYYVLAAGLQTTVGPGFGPGRALSFIAGLVAAGLVCHLAWQRARSWWAGLLAALLFLALGLPWLYSWSALYRVDTLGVALSLGAVAVLAGGTTRRRLLLAGLLAALAILTKQTLIAAGLAGAVWLWGRDQKEAALFVGTVLTLVLGACAALEITTGAFVANTIFANANPFLIETLRVNVTGFLFFQAGPLAIAALHLVARRRRGETDELFGYYWAASLLPVLALGKVGASQNYWIEFAAITAVVAAVGLCADLSERDIRGDCGRPAAPLLLLGVTLALVTPLVVVSALPALGQLWPSARPTEAFGRLVERVRTEPGDVLAVPPDVVVLAGRPILFEPAIFGILHSQGSWEAAPLVHRICAGHVGMLVLGERLEVGDEQRDHYGNWPAPVLSALRHTMVLERVQAGRYLYVPARAAGNGDARADAGEPCPGKSLSSTWDGDRPSAAELRRQSAFEVKGL